MFHADQKILTIEVEPVTSEQIKKLPTPICDDSEWSDGTIEPLVARDLERKLAAAVDLLEGICPHMDKPWQEVIDETLSAIKEPD